MAVRKGRRQKKKRVVDVERKRETEREKLNEGERERGESEIIGATSKTREPRGYPRGNVIGSWARGGPFGGAFWVRRGWGWTTGSQSFLLGASVRGPKPPQSATTKTPRSLFHERPTTPLDPSLCLSAHAHVRLDTRPRLRPL